MKKLCLLTVLMAVLTIVCFTSVGCTDKKPAPAIDSASSDSVIADTQAMDSTEQLIEETPVPKAADELFDDFVFNFAANRKLQKSRIVFPLPVYHGKKLTKKIEKNHWKMEHFFMRQDYYTLIFDNQKQMKLMKDTTIDHVVIEKVFYSRKTVQQFVFNRINGQWMMTSICYVPMYQNNNASFLKFYGHFATDTAFQARHIHNPVKFTGPDPDDDFSTMACLCASTASRHDLQYNLWSEIYREQPENLRDSWYCQWYGNLSYFQKDWRKMGTDQTEYVAF